MNMDTIILGLVQGFTEFLPVSSSGHLALAKIFLGMEMPPLNYDLVLHVSTTLATVIFFFSDICSLFMEWCKGFGGGEARSKPGWSVGWSVVLGTFVTGAIGMSIKTFSEEASQNSLIVGICLLITGVMLLLSRWINGGDGRVSLKNGAAVGVIQGIAVMPGISRSGSTIIAGRASGLSKEEAFRISFLLSIPAIIGATCVQALEFSGWDSFASTLPDGWLVGAVCSFASGLLSLFLLKRLVIASKWWYFGVYCLAVGGLSVILTYMGGW